MSQYLEFMVCNQWKPSSANIVLSNLAHEPMESPYKHIECALQKGIFGAYAYHEGPDQLANLAIWAHLFEASLA